MTKFADMCRKMFRVGCIGFGGGNALVPILEAAFVDENNKEETAAALDRDVVVANVTPGALPVEIAGSLGRRTCGIKGMFAAPVMFTLPGVLGTLVLMMLMSGLQESAMNMVLIGAAGISAFIISLLLEYMVRVFKASAEEGKSRIVKVLVLVVGVTVLISGGSFYKILGIDRTPFFGISTLSLLLAMFFWAFFVNTKRDVVHTGFGAVLTMLYLVGSGRNGLLSDSPAFAAVKGLMVLLAVIALGKSVKDNKAEFRIDAKSLSKDLLLWAGFAAVLSIPSMILTPSLFEFPGRAFLSTLMSFGGGDAYLTIADGVFVASGMISEDVFYGQVVTVVNVLPGSILCKCLFSMGFYIGNQAGGALTGAALGLCGYACSVAASCGIFFVMHYLYDSLKVLDSFSFVSRWIRPVVVGLLIKVILGLLVSNVALCGFSGRSILAIVLFTAVLAAGNYLFRRKKKNMNVLLIIVDIAAAMLFMLI